MRQDRDTYDEDAHGGRMLASLVVIAAVNALLLAGCYLAWAVTR